MTRSKLFGAALLAAAASLAPALRAETVGMGTVWYDDVALTGQNSGPSYGFWAPSGNASASGFTFTAGSDVLTNDGGTYSTGQVYLQNLVMVNATSGASTTAFLTVVDTTTNTVVGSSTNSVTLTSSATQSAGTPWSFNSLGLDAGKRYAFVFTTTAGVAGTSTIAIPADGGQIAGGTDLDAGAGTLSVVSYRLGGLTSNQTANRIADSGVLTPGVGTFGNTEVWFSAGLTTTNQSLQALAGGSADATQSAAITTASGLRKTGTATYTLTSTAGNSIAGDIFVEQGGLKVNTAANGNTSSIVGSGQIYLINANPGATAVTQNNATMSGTTFEVNTAAGNATLNTAVEGAGKLVKSGANTLTVTSTNSFSGNLQVLAGTLSVSTVSNIGAASQIGRGNSSQDSITLVGSTFTYTGGAGSTNRRFGIAPSGGTILSSGTGALQITGSGNIGSNGIAAGATVRNLTLGGTYVGDANVFGNNIVDYVAGTATNLTKSGAGTWALTGSNTYTGTTTVSAGTLQVGNGGGTGALGTGGVSLAAGTSLKFNRTGLLTVGAAISGSGDISVDGTGEVSLTGANTLTGALAVNAGVLAFEGLTAAGSHASVTVGASGRVALGATFIGQTLTLKNLSGAGTINTMFNAGAGTRTLAVNSSADTTFSGTLGEDLVSGRVLALTKTGNATLTLSGTSAYSGGTTLSAGTLNVLSDAALGTGSVTAAGGSLSGTASLANALVLAADLTVTGNGSLSLSGGVTETGSARTLTKAGAGTLTLGGTVAHTGATVVSAGKLALAAGATLASPSVILADGAQLESADTFVLGAGKSLSLGSANAIASASHTGALSLSGGVINLDFNGTTHDALSVSGDLSLASGTIVFNNASTYSTGVYDLLTYGGAYTAPAQASDLTLSGLSAGGTSRQSFALTHDEVAKAIQLTVEGSGEAVTWTGAVDGSWGVGGSSTANWQVTTPEYAGDNPNRFFNGDLVTFADGPGSGAVVIGADDLTPVSVTFAADALDYVLSSDGGAIAGGSLTKTGIATLTLASAHTYLGGTTLTDGRLRLGADGALGSGTLTVNGGRLSSAGTDARAVANAVRFAADVELGDADDNGELTFSGAVDLDAAARTLTLLSDVKVTGTLSSGSLTKAGSGKLTLAGANALGVSLAVSEGTVALGASGVVSDTAAITLASGTTLDLAGFSESLGSLSVGDGATVTAGTLTGGTVTLTDGAVFGATLDGTSALVKQGAFALTLSSASSRTGATTLGAGSILVGDAAALGTGTLALNGGTLAMADATDRTLSNNVTLGGSVTLGAAGTGKLTLAGTVALGGSNRTLTLANDARLSGVVSNGALTKAGNGVLTLAASNTYTGGTTIVSGAVVATAANSLGTGGTVTLNTAATGSDNTSLLVDASGGTITLARAITVAGEGTGVASIGSSAFGLSTQQVVFSGAVTLGKGVTLLGASGGDRTQFSGGITGTGDVTVSTTGDGRVLFLSAAHTYTGNLTVAANSRLQLSDGTSTGNSLIPDAAIVTLQAGANLRFAKGGNAATEVVGGFLGTGTVTAISGADKLEVSHADTQTMSVSLAESGGTLALTKSGAGSLTFDGAYGITGGLTVTAGTLTFANAVNLAGNTTVRGRLVLSGNTLLGNNLVNSGTNTDAEVDFGANTVTIGTASSGEAYYGKLTGTGTIVLAGGTGSIANITDGTVAGSVAGNRQVWVQTAAGVIQDTSVQFFALNTGVSAANRRDFIFANDTGEALFLSAFSGYGSIRGDWGGTAGQTVTRRFIVDQDTDTVFNGAFLSHRSGSGALRALSLTKRGSGRLEMAGFIGKQTASAQAGVAGVHLAVEEGELDVTNAANTTTTNTGAIDLATVTVTGGTLGFAAQSLVNTAGTAGASAILLDGGTLRWNAGNTQDVSLGGRLQLVSGKSAKFDVGANDVTLSAALAGAADGSLTKLGNGTLTLSGANTFTGGTTLSAGKLVAGNVSAFGTGDILLSAGILDFNNLDVLNRVIFAGGTLINVRSGGAVAIDDSLTAEQINALDIPAIAATAGTTLDLTGVTKEVVVTGSATLTGLAGFSGNLRVTAGVLDLSDPDNRPVRGVGGSFPGTIELGGGGSADFGTADFDGPIIYKGGTVTGAFTGNLNVAGTGIALTAGAISGGKVVVTTDNSVAIGAGFAGTVRLEGGSVTSGIDTFAGTVELGSAGALNLTTDLATSATVVIDNGGVLRGTGTVAGLTVSSGGLLAPGNSPGMTTVTGSLRLEGGALDLEILSTGGEIFDPVAGGDYDSVTVGGDLDLTALTLENRFLINVISLLDPTTPGQVGDFDPALTKVYDVYAYSGELMKSYAGSATDLFQLDTSEFTVDGLAIDPLLFSLVHNSVDKKIQLVYAPIPEPSTYGLILGGLALAGAAIRRRRKAAK